MKKKLQNINYSIAGLLHDIGKFGQRADKNFYDKSDYIKEQSKKKDGIICKKHKDGYYTHLHVLWTDQFLSNFQTLLTECKLYDKNDAANNIINLAAYHHNPATVEHSVITLADHWASGIDRNTTERLNIKNPDAGRDLYKSEPLLTIFNTLKSETNQVGTESNYGYNVQSFSIDESMFPILKTEINNKENYSKLWHEFNKEFKSIKTSNPNAFVATLYHVLKKYTWYIPASTQDYQDTSLFEHCKITGAFAHCIKTYMDENPESFIFDTTFKSINFKDKIYPVLMVCGDISGIQKFIYNITSKSAMKSLKGRSFYVQALTEVICDELLETCGASIINQVYSAGGKFYVLLPNTIEVNNAIDKYTQDIQQKLWEDFSVNISCNVGRKAFGFQKNGNKLSVQIEGEGEDKTVGDLWKIVADETSTKKNTRFNNIIANNYENLFLPSGTGKDTDVCSITGEELQRNKVSEIKDKNQTIKVSKSVMEMIEFGKKLYDPKYLVYNGNSGTAIGLNSRIDIENNEKLVNTSHPLVYQIGFEKTPNLDINRITDLATGIGFKLYGGIPMVHNDDKVTELQDLCLKNDKQEKLAIVRMDVDNLGNMFQDGFKGSISEENNRKAASFSKLATMSTLFDLYFSGYLNTLKNNIKYKDNVNIVYAGGDDVFALGRWDLIIDFAYDVRKDFQKFVCNRTDISISAGIAIVGAKYPISKGAELAGKAEEDAKNINTEISKKNAISLFGIALSWAEFEWVNMFKDKLTAELIHDKITKGTLMKLFDYYQIYEYENKEKESNQNHKINVSWRWQAAYYLKRASNEGNNDFMDKLKNLLLINRYENKYIRFEATIVACRWAELLNKK